MANSYSQTASITCPQCQSTFEAEVWLIVDCAEKPDLLARAAQGKLHAFACPTCGQIDQSIDAPLLLYRGPWDRLAFSPAQGTTQEQDQQQAGGLLGHLSESLGTIWKEDWLKEVVTLPRADLPVYLLEGPEAAQRKLAEARASQMAELRANDPAAFRQAALQSWLSARSMDEKQSILEDTPELLQAETENQLQEMEARAAAEQNQEMAGFFQAHRELLARCRTEGVAAVFEELQKNAEQASGFDVPSEFADDFSKVQMAVQACFA